MLPRRSCTVCGIPHCIGEGGLLGGGGTCFTIAAKNLPTLCSGGQVVNAIRPPSLVTLISSFAATSGRGVNICPRLENTMSNELSGKGRSSASPCFHSIPSVTPARAASSFARSKSSGVRSIPITFPPALHAVMAVMPVPHATSSTCSPRLTLAARTK